MDASLRGMAYRVEIGPQAQTQFGKLDPVISASIERKIVWAVRHKRRARFQPLRFDLDCSKLFS